MRSRVKIKKGNFMKRHDIIKKLAYEVPYSRTKRVVLSTDLKNEADDQFAVMHHLLTPGHDVTGIVAAHFEGRRRFADESKKGDEAGDPLAHFMLPRGESMMASYDEGKLLLELAEIDDVPLFKGCCYEIGTPQHNGHNGGVDFIIQEALKEDDRPLYVCALGAITDVAAAIRREPAIAGRMTIIWIGGGDYPEGELEFNLMQDVEAARIVFASEAEVWQVPKGVYKMVELSFAELVTRVKGCGKVGDYLCQQMLDLNEKGGAVPGDFPHGESWCLGDNPTVSVLLQNAQRICWHMEKAPYINDDGSYSEGQIDRLIRVYDSVDSRLTLEDMFHKLAICYK